LGLKQVIKKYGFRWLRDNLFNWKVNNFAQGIAEQFPFPVRQLQKRYQRRGREKGTMVGVLQELDQVIGRIQILGENDEEGKKRLMLLRWLATRIM